MVIYDYHEEEDDRESKLKELVQSVLRERERKKKQNPSSFSMKVIMFDLTS